MIIVDVNPFFSQTPDFEIALKTAILKIFGCAINDTYANIFLDHVTIDTFDILIL